MSNLMENAIKASFLKLLAEKPLNRITVREIAEDCGINRNSFYYHYHDIPELLEEILKDEVDSLILAYPDVSSLEECVEAAFTFILKNKKSIHHIYHSVDREIFERDLMHVCDYAITTWYESAVPSQKKDSDGDLFSRPRILRFLRYELFGACIDFINEGMPPEAIDEARNLLQLSRELLRQSGLHLAG